MGYMGQCIQEKVVNYFRKKPFNFFNGCFPQILLGPFLNILSHVYT